MALRYLRTLSHHLRLPPLRNPPHLATHQSGGTNLEIFKFGMYIMFPIGFMWYFGLNLENRFAVPDFWPEPGTTHKIPFEKEELREMGEQLRLQRLERRRRRLEAAEKRGEMGRVDAGREDGAEGSGGRDAGRMERVANMEAEEGLEERRERRMDGRMDGRFGAGAIERWARGQ